MRQQLKNAGWLFAYLLPERCVHLQFLLENTVFALDCADKPHRRAFRKRIVHRHYSGPYRLNSAHAHPEVAIRVGLRQHTNRPHNREFANRRIFDNHINVDILNGNTMPVGIMQCYVHFRRHPRQRNFFDFDRVETHKLGLLKTVARGQQ